MLQAQDQTERISIHALREEGDLLVGIPPTVRVISIHALREEGDRHRWPHRDVRRDFYPRPPRGGRPRGSTSPATRPDFYPRPPRGGRHPDTSDRQRISGFLSTPSARRATRTAEAIRNAFIISIHALREEGDKRGDKNAAHRQISIHALREEGDAFCRVPKSHSREFLSTPSARRATSGAFYRAYSPFISIHALREEGDSKNRDKISIFKQIIQHSARI